MNRQAITGRAGPLFVDDGGGGPAGAAALPVLFVHSFAGSSAHWRGQLEHLRGQRRALAMDLRGHGASMAPEEARDFTLADLAADVASVADGASLDRFVLVGHSLGGAVATAYASAHPARVAGLVLACAPGRTPPEQAEAALAALRNDFEQALFAHWATMLEGARPAVRAQLEDDLRRMMRGPALTMIAAQFAHDPLPLLARYHGPLQLIDTPHGDGPGALHRLLPQAERRLIAGTSHWPQLDDPAAFDAALDAFLARL